MLAKVKYKIPTVKKNTVEDQFRVIDGVQIPAKPNVGDYLYIDPLQLLVTRVTVVCRESKDKNMKRPNLLITCEAVQEI